MPNPLEKLNDITSLSDLSGEELKELGEEIAQEKRGKEAVLSEELCKRCGDHLPGSLIIGSGRWCECGKLANAAWSAIEHVDPEAQMTFMTLETKRGDLEKVASELEKIALGERRKGFFMFGLPGRGKTHLSIATARQILEGTPGGLCGVFNLAGLVSRIQATYGYEDSDESKAKIIESVCRHDAVILDDFGKEHRSADVDSIVYQLIDGLYNAKRILIASSNLPGPEFVERYDGAVLSRLGGMCEKVVIRGEDRRAAVWSW